jgi:hypothetical protein
MLTLIKPFSFVCYVVPLLKTGALAQPATFFNYFTMKKLKKKQHMHDQLHLSAAILAQWWHPVAYSEALDLLHWAMQVVTYRCITMAIKIATKVGVFLHRCFV